MNHTKIINNTHEMVDFIERAYRKHLDDGVEARKAMVAASRDLFMQMLPEKARVANTRRNAPSVFREWFTQWKSMIVKVNKYIDNPEVKLVDASFPMLFWIADPEFFLALYDARVFLTPMPDELLKLADDLRKKMVQDNERERQAILAKHHASFIDRAMANYLRNTRDLFHALTK